MNTFTMWTLDILKQSKVIAIYKDFHLLVSSEVVCTRVGVIFFLPDTLGILNTASNQAFSMHNLPEDSFSLCMCMKL